MAYCEVDNVNQLIPFHGVLSYSFVLHNIHTRSHSRAHVTTIITSFQNHESNEHSLLASCIVIHCI